jgi:creatinine amidohydrolase/Fe(II)-dependent formamide hydrolase-like protein
MKQVARFLSLCCCLAVAVSAGAATPNKDPRSRGGGRCEKNTYNCVDTPNPLPKVDTVWLEEMTWMDVRDAMAAGKKTIIIPTGGVEPNGPWVALGKHDYVVHLTCDAIARKLGNALCAPVVGFVDEGDLETRTGHMDTAGTITVKPATYDAIIADVARSMQASGFQNIILMSDNGGSNAESMKTVAEKLNKEWGVTTVYFIPEYYKSWDGADAILLRKGLTKQGVRDAVHDDPSVESLLMVADPNYVRWSQRVKLHQATIDGVSIADKKKAQQVGRELLEYRAAVTVDAINKALAGKGRTQ